MSLKEFFVDKYITYPFKLFGKTHIFLLVSLGLIIILIIKNKYKLYNLKNSTKIKLTKIFASILLLNMVILYVSSFYYHNFDYKSMLPIHLCYLSNYLYIFTVLFNKKKLFKYTYFLGFIGPIPAIIFFDVPSVFEAFNFYLYIISHHVFLIFTLITFYFYPKRLCKLDFLKLFLTLNVFYFLINIFNNIFNTNYFFTKNIPLFIINLLPFLKVIPDVLILEILVILILVVMNIFFNHECFIYLNDKL